MSKYIPYHEPSIRCAEELTRGASSDAEKYRIITEFVTKSFRYDYIRAVTIPKKNGLPDLERTWEKKRGICLDIAAMTTGMLRAVGLHAFMCWGKADKKNHAWVEARIGGEWRRYDFNGKAKTYKAERVF